MRDLVAERVDHDEAGDPECDGEHGGAEERPVLDEVHRRSPFGLEGCEPPAGAHEGARTGEDEKGEDERGEEQTPFHAVTGSPSTGV